MVTLRGISWTLTLSETAGKCGADSNQPVARDRLAAEKETTMVIRTAAVLALLLAAAPVAGCGKSSGTPGVASARSGAPAASRSAASQLSDQEKALRFAQCMRANGVPDFPDPKVDANGDFGIDPGNADPKKVDAAMEKCKQYAPSGGTPGRVDPQIVEQNRKVAQCMRDNGFPTFPDPNEQGGLAIDPNKLGITGRPEDDPKYRAAWQKCSQYLPSGGAGGSTHSEGGN
jgi:hypothetical protein